MSKRQLRTECLNSCYTASSNTDTNVLHWGKTLMLLRLPVFKTNIHLSYLTWIPRGKLVRNLCEIIFIAKY